jgi:hypothetical protein
MKDRLYRHLPDANHSVVELEHNRAARKPSLKHPIQRAMVSLRTQQDYHAHDWKLVAIARQNIISQKPPSEQIVIRGLKLDVG